MSDNQGGARLRIELLDNGQIRLKFRIEDATDRRYTTILVLLNDVREYDIFIAILREMLNIKAGMKLTHHFKYFILHAKGVEVEGMREGYAHLFFKDNLLVKIHSVKINELYSSLIQGIELFSEGKGA